MGKAKDLFSEKIAPSICCDSAEKNVEINDDVAIKSFYREAKCNERSTRERIMEKRKTRGKKRKELILIARDCSVGFDDKVNKASGGNRLLQLTFRVATS